MKFVLVALLLCTSLIINAQDVDIKLNQVNYGLGCPFEKSYLRKNPETIVTVYYLDKKYHVQFKDIDNKGFLTEEDFLNYIQRVQIKEEVNTSIKDQTND